MPKGRHGVGSRVARCSPHVCRCVDLQKPFDCPFAQVNLLSRPSTYARGEDPLDVFRNEARFFVSQMLNNSLGDRARLSTQKPLALAFRGPSFHIFWMFEAS